MSVNQIPLSGKEPLVYNSSPINYSTLDFWKWSCSDLLSNTTRGRFAEFIVATAIGIKHTDVREEWANYDLITTEGIKIEVKSAAYIQTWEQRKNSQILFKVKPTYGWDDSLAKRSPDKAFQADTYVFCLLKTEDKQSTDPLNLNQWEFYILSREELIRNFSNSAYLSLKKLRDVTQAVSYMQLRPAIVNKMV